MLKHKHIRTTTTYFYQIPLFSGLNILHAREIVTHREVNRLDISLILAEMGQNWRLIVSVTESLKGMLTVPSWEILCCLYLVNFDRRRIQITKPFGSFLYPMVPPKVLSGYFSIQWFHRKSSRVTFYSMVSPKVLWVISPPYGSSKSPVGSLLYLTVWFRQKSCWVISLSYCMVPPEVL